MRNEDKIMKRLQELETKSSNHEISKLIYGEICNELVNPFMPIRQYPRKFEMTKMDKFKSKEDPKK